MKIPFIQHIGIGLHISDDAVRWVKLSRMGSNISIEQAECVEVTGGNISDALTKLLERVKPGFEYVTVNVDSDEVYRLITDVPELDDEKEVGFWLSEIKKEAIPESYAKEDIAVSHHFFGNPEDNGLKCLLVAVPQKDIQERIDLVESAGLKPIILTSGDLEGRYAVMFDEELNHSDTLYLNEIDGQFCLQQLSDGMLEHHYLFPEKEMTLEDCIREVESLIASQVNLGQEVGSRLFLSTSQELQEAEFQSEILEVKELSPLAHLSFKESGLSSDYTLACGMAVKQLFNGIDEINLLDKNKNVKAEDNIQKKDTLHLGVILGSVLLMLWLILFSAQLYFNYNIKEATQKVTLLKDKITRLTDARDEVLYLKEHALGARSVLGQRTNAAKVIEETGKSLPEGTWLTELEIENISNEREKFELKVIGYAENEALVTVFLEKLESNKSQKQVRLIYSEQMEFKDVYEKSRYSGEKMLVYFEIRMKHYN